jgi:hypothetical protein
MTARIKDPVEVANSYADSEAVANALPRLEDALRRLQTERAETHRDLSDEYARLACAKEALKARGINPYCE